MKKGSSQTSKSAQEAHDHLLKLGLITVQMSAIERAVQYPQGRPENDAEHSYHLGLSAIEIAATYYPDLSSGLVAEFSLVHDLAEIYTGDVPTFGISAENRAAKEAAEKESVERLLKELPPYTAQLLQRYEQQIEPEARFVRFIDKLLPAIIHSVAPDANREAFMKTYNIDGVEDAQAKRLERVAMLQQMFPEFPFIHIVHDLVQDEWRERIFNEDV